jgi:hypothetical protein
LNSLREYLTVVGFSLISARFLRRDHPNDLLAAPRVGDPVNFSFDTAKGHEIAAGRSPSSIPSMISFGEHLGGGEKRNAVLRKSVTATLRNPDTTRRPPALPKSIRPRYIDVRAG